jgi:hypothetical protein
LTGDTNAHTGLLPDNPKISFLAKYFDYDPEIMHFYETHNTIKELIIPLNRLSHDKKNSNST